MNLAKIVKIINNNTPGGMTADKCEDIVIEVINRSGLKIENIDRHTALLVAEGSTRGYNKVWEGIR